MQCYHTCIGDHPDDNICTRIKLPPTVGVDLSLVMRSSDKKEAISSCWPSASCCESLRLRFLDFCSLTWRAALFTVLSFTVSRLPFKKGSDSWVSTTVTLSSSANSTIAKTPLKRKKQNFNLSVSLTNKNPRAHCYNKYSLIYVLHQARHMLVMQLIITCLAFNNLQDIFKHKYFLHNYMLPMNIPNMNLTTGMRKDNTIFYSMLYKQQHSTSSFCSVSMVWTEINITERWAK